MKNLGQELDSKPQQHLLPSQNIQMAHSVREDAFVFLSFWFKVIDTILPPRQKRKAFHKRTTQILLVDPWLILKNLQFVYLNLYIPRRLIVLHFNPIGIQIGLASDYKAGLGKIRRIYTQL